MILHSLNKSPFTHSTLIDCLALMAESDSLILIEDGVYAALENSPAYQKLQELAKQKRLYALQDDISARGLQTKTLPELQVVSYPEFVDLCCSHNNVQSWY